MSVCSCSPISIKRSCTTLRSLSAISPCTPSRRQVRSIDENHGNSPESIGGFQRSWLHLRGEERRDPSLKASLTLIRRCTTEPTRGDAKASKYRQKRPSTTYDDGPVPIYTQQVGGSSPSAQTSAQTSAKTSAPTKLRCANHSATTYADHGGSLPIGVCSMSDGGDFYRVCDVVNEVQHSIVTSTR